MESGWAFLFPKHPLFFLNILVKILKIIELDIRKAVFLHRIQRPQKAHKSNQHEKAPSQHRLRPHPRGSPSSKARHY